jgi:hypothetical protein
MSMKGMVMGAGAEGPDPKKDESSAAGEDSHLL